MTGQLVTLPTLEREERWFRRVILRKPFRLGTEPGYVTGMKQVIRNLHSPDACAGRPCVIHNPSDHSMREFPTNWRDGGMFDIKPPHMERICPHGVGHPDPDDAAYQASVGQDVSVHGCDGCCNPAVRHEINELSEIYAVSADL
jgi:hypothetical protein